jgi:glucose/arabinose dehydrogenase
MIVSRVRRSFLVVVALGFTAATLAANVPPGFQDTLHVQTLGDPRAIAWHPNGELWILMGYGTVFAYRNGSLVQIAAIPTHYAGESGASSLVFDPDYVTNQHVWIFYKTPPPTTRNRVSRFTHQGNALVGETVMLDGPITVSDFHNGGTIRFASDKTLFVTMGDDTLGTPVAQDPHELRGKVLRINRDGSPAAGNPYDGVSGDPRVWAIGFRNPFRFNLQPGTGNLFIGDVGAGTREEIDIGVAGANFGWANVEGDVPPGQPGFVYPIYAYDHSGPGFEAVIGGDHAGPGDFAPEYEGDYFFADWGNNEVYRMTLDASNNPTSTEVWATDVRAPVDMQFGPDGSLYYASRDGAMGGIRKISYVSGGNRQPVAKASASPDSGSAPLTTTLVGSSSFDPDGHPLTHAWDLGDGSQASGPVVNHAYAAGVYVARLTVEDGQGGSSTAPAVRIVSGNNRPTAGIATPADESGFDAGQLIPFSGTGNDTEEGGVPCSRFRWKVSLHHGSHSHPFLGPTEGSCNGSFTTAERGETSADTYYEIQLTVKDQGSPLGAQATLTGSRSIEIRPNTSTMSFVSTPLPDLQLTLDGQPYTPPRSVLGVVNFVRAIGAVEPQPRGDGHTYRWLSWSDGGARDHEIRTPSTSATYTATFGCDVLVGVQNLRLAKGAAGQLLLSWTPVVDACLAAGPARYRVYAAATSVPSSPPGDFPGDPQFILVGSSTVASFSYPPGPTDRFFLVGAVGTDGLDGPVEHYDD